MSDATPARPRFDVRSVVRHAHFASDGVMGYDGALEQPGALAAEVKALFSARGR